MSFTPKKADSPQDSYVPELQENSEIEEEILMMGEVVDSPVSLTRTQHYNLDGEFRVGEFVEKYMCWRENEQMDLSFRPWLHRIYQSEHIIPVENGVQLRPKRRTLLKSARQCEKSTSLGNKILMLSAKLPNVTTVFVSSAELNAKEFSSERIDNIIRVSPRLRNILGEPLENNVFTKRFLNNSRIVIRAVNDTTGAARTRGISGDIAVVDEIQDVASEHIPVITSCTNNSSLTYGPIHLFSGTPLSSENYISQLWEKNSTKNIWLTRCDKCRHWSPPYPKTLGKLGMVCEKCGSPINPLNGQWVSERTLNLEKIAYEGYHISRVMMPYTRIQSIQAFEDSWHSLYQDATNPTYSETTINNEIFGLEHGSGRKPISREELMALCHPEHTSKRLLPSAVRDDPSWPVFAGIDWGEGSGEGGYTIVTIGYLNHIDGKDKTVISYIKRYEGAEADPSFVKEDLCRLIIENNVQLCICDAGHGWGMIDHLWDNIPNGRKRVIPMLYTNQSQVLTMDPSGGRFQANRTRWMARTFSMMQRGLFLFPRWSEFEEPFATDIMNIFADKSPSLRQMVYRHTSTDDCFHAILYLHTARLYHYRELDAILHA